MSEQLPTLGIWGPAPRDKSGVAGYITHSLPHLARHFTTHRITGPGHDPAAFDHVLYHLGNNALHHGAFRALAARPGTILLHEYNNLDYYYEAWDQLPAAEQQAVLTRVGNAVGTRLDTRADMEQYFADHPHVDRYSLNARIEDLAIGAATRVLVHSPLLAEHLADRHPTADIRHLPFPAEPLTPVAGTRARHGLPEQAFVFATFGFLGAYKRIPTLLDAWQNWTDRPADALLLLAGEARDGLTVPADDPTVLHTGYLPDAEFDALLLAADCGIQLRGPWLGETSGPASVLIAHRRPTILSDIPGMHPRRPEEIHLLVGQGEHESADLIDAMRTQYHRPRTPAAYDPAFSWKAWGERIAAALTGAAA
ncbi:hypothetical protein ACFRMQ_19540 [Kitasatospora sp. NPDC056783]|uniref:hypothetical protein n=1 Tax=Kitasatospora sp. NPDC056783 TaxID=3345943 RepID=UPI0036AA1102